MNVNENSADRGNPTHRQPARVVALAAAAAIALAACGGSSPPRVVASLGDSGSHNVNGRSTTAPPKGNPTKLLDEWATCMRNHGDPGQADPTITADKLIDINWNPAIPGGYNGTNKGGQGNSGPGQFCRAYLNAAQMALQGGRLQNPPDPARVEKFSRCMRASGIPDFPDPTPNGLVMSIHPGTDLDPSNPTFQNASKQCARRSGVRDLFGGTPPPGTIELNGGGLGATAG